MNTKSYNRSVSISYAKKWALARNPRYYNFVKVRFIHIVDVGT